MSQYNYNVLERTNDGTNFEWNTNSTVLFIDELPTGITLNLHIDDESNPGLLLREKTQLRFKESNRLIFKPSGSTSGTIRLFLYYDQSNILEFDQSYYATAISGTVDVDITAQSLSVLNNNLKEIGSSETPVTNLENILQANNPDATRIIKWTYLNTSASSIIYTVGSGKTLYITNAWLSIFGLSDVDSGGILMHRDSTPTDIGVLLQAGMQDIGGSFAYSTSYNIPYKLESDDDLELQGDSNSWTATGFTGVLIG
jgi:hypothetical protein